MAIINKKKYETPRLTLTKSGTVYSSSDDAIKNAKEIGLRLVPFDIERFIKFHNIIILYEQMKSNEISGYLQYRRSNRWVIGVNKYHSPRRQRFTLAHEFAHFCFDQDYYKTNDNIHHEILLFRDNSFSEEEVRANEFASDILIPEKEFKNLIEEQHMRNIEDLANYFDVSLAAIRYKAYKLNYIKEY